VQGRKKVGRRGTRKSIILYSNKALLSRGDGTIVSFRIYDYGTE
jgi:hypothetical protein